MNGHGTLVLPSRRVLTCGQLHLSHPRLSLRTYLGDRAVSPGTPGPIGTHVVRDRRVSPNPVSRSAATCDEVGTGRDPFPRRGQRGNPLANGQNSSWVAKLTVDKTVGSSLTVLGSCRKTGVSLWGCMGSLTTGSPTGPRSTFGESGLNVYSLATVRTRKVRAVLRWDWGH